MRCRELTLALDAALPDDVRCWGVARLPKSFRAALRVSSSGTLFEHLEFPRRATLGPSCVHRVVR